jgi:hypothetical protein
MKREKTRERRTAKHNFDGLIQRKKKQQKKTKFFNGNKIAKYSVSLFLDEKLDKKISDGAQF